MPVFLSFDMPQKLPPLSAGFCLVSAMLLTGCGGGGSNSTPPETNKPANSDFQGIWSSKSANASTSTIVLPDLRMWTVVSEGSTLRLITAQLATVGTKLSGEGKTYIIGTNGSSTTTVTLSKNYATAITVDIVAGSQKTSRLETYQSKYEVPVTLADFAKSWSAIVGVGKFNWTVSVTGAITGNSSTGCTYAGQLTERPERKSVMEASITETCVSTVTKLQGISTLNVDKNQWNLVATTSDATNGLVISLATTP
jgi:hypothetical protein